MKKRYSKQIIRNSIAYWQQRLDEMNLVTEASSEMLDAFKRKFGPQKFRSYKRDFNFENNSDITIYNMLNQYMFNDSLHIPSIMLADTLKEMKELIRERKGKETDNIYYGAYVPYVDTNISTNDPRFPVFIHEEILINCGFGPMTVPYAISVMCHEMIHQYVAHNSDILRTQALNPQYDEHDNPLFDEYMKIANANGLNVMKYSDGISFPQMNRIAIDKSSLFEDEQTVPTFKEIADRIKNGERFPGYCLDKDGNLGIIFI